MAERPGSSSALARARDWLSGLLAPRSGMARLRQGLEEPAGPPVADNPPEAEAVVVEAREEAGVVLQIARPERPMRNLRDIKRAFRHALSQTAPESAQRRAVNVLAILITMGKEAVKADVSEEKSFLKLNKISPERALEILMDVILTAHPEMKEEDLKKALEENKAFLDLLVEDILQAEKIVRMKGGAAAKFAEIERRMEKLAEAILSVDEFSPEKLSAADAAKVVEALAKMRKNPSLTVKAAFGLEEKEEKTKP